jgi:hypothetical protein
LTDPVGVVRLDGVTDAAARSRVRAWRYALSTTNPPEGPIDPVTRWIVISRVAGLLAARAPGVDWRWLVLAVIGITLAHLANNLMNDSTTPAPVRTPRATLGRYMPRTRSSPAWPPAGRWSWRCWASTLPTW